MTSEFYGYAGKYISAESIKTGKGYWVKVGQDGSLLLSSNAQSNQAGKINIISTSELPPPPPFEESSPEKGNPKEFSLQENFPNPFNPSTQIRYNLPKPIHVRLNIYDLLGREVATLINEFQNAGYKSVSFDASSLPSGVYIYRLQAGTFSDVKKMILMK